MDNKQAKELVRTFVQVPQASGTKQEEIDFYKDINDAFVMFLNALEENEKLDDIKAIIDLTDAYISNMKNDESIDITEFSLEMQKLKAMTYSKIVNVIKDDKNESNKNYNSLDQQINTCYENKIKEMNDVIKGYHYNITDLSQQCKDLKKEIDEYEEYTDRLEKQIEGYVAKIDDLKYIISSYREVFKDLGIHIPEDENCT